MNTINPIYEVQSDLHGNFKVQFPLTTNEYNAINKKLNSGPRYSDFIKCKPIHGPAVKACTFDFFVFLVSLYYGYPHETIKNFNLLFEYSFEGETLGKIFEDEHRKLHYYVIHKSYVARVETRLHLESEIEKIMSDNYSEQMSVLQYRLLLFHKVVECKKVNNLKFRYSDEGFSNFRDYLKQELQNIPHINRRKSDLANDINNWIFGQELAIKFLLNQIERILHNSLDQEIFRLNLDETMRYNASSNKSEMGIINETNHISRELLSSYTNCTPISYKVNWLNGSHYNLQRDYYN